MTTVADVEVSPAAGHIGAEITDVDLAGPLDDTVVAAIRAAVLRWKVVFFRDQKLDHAAHITFARRFGKLGHLEVPWQCIAPGLP